MFIDEHSASEFFKSEFFNRFNDRCKEIIMPVLSLSDDADFGEFRKYIKNNKDNIVRYMFNGIY